MEFADIPVIQLKRSLDKGGDTQDDKNIVGADEDDEDPYAWLSRTAPPSPGSTKRTKKKSETRTDDDEQFELEKKEETIRRVSSREKMKRRLYKALEGNEPGGLPAVQRAKPRLDEYEEINRSCEVSRSPSPVPSTPGNLGSMEGSQESLASSPEQMTVSRRPLAQEEFRPPLSNIFEKEKS
jgi:hypothetical protein